MHETKAAPQQKSKMLYTHLELLLVITIWAGTFVATKIVLEQIPPALSALYRYLVASVILILLDHGNRQKIKKEDYPVLIFLGLTGVTLYYLLQHYGIRHTGATDAAILISLSPVFIALISWVLMREPVKPAGMAGLIMALTGSFLVITNGHIIAIGSGARFKGDILILLTAVSWAFYSVYGKKLLNRYRTITIIKYTTIIGTVLLFPFTLPELIHYGLPNLDAFGWLNMLYLGGAASVYGYLAWYRALAILPAVTVGSYLYFRPLLTAVIAAVILNEKISLYGITGGLLIIIGTYLTAKQKAASS